MNPYTEKNLNVSMLSFVNEEEICILGVNIPFHAFGSEMAKVPKV